MAEDKAIGEVMTSNENGSGEVSISTKFECEPAREIGRLLAAEFEPDASADFEDWAAAEDDFVLVDVDEAEEASAITLAASSDGGDRAPEAASAAMRCRVTWSSGLPDKTENVWKWTDQNGLGKEVEEFKWKLNSKMLTKMQNKDDAKWFQKNRDLDSWFGREMIEWSSEDATKINQTQLHLKSIRRVTTGMLTETQHL